jgi:hypothetical protein
MKITKKHYKVFKKEFLKWVKHFGLYGNRYYFQHKNVNIKNAFAYCIFPDDYDDRVFTIGLPKRTRTRHSMTDIRKVAFHEAMEVLLYRIRFLAGCRYPQQADIDDEIHNLVRIFENCVFRGMGETRKNEPTKED